MRASVKASTLVIAIVAISGPPAAAQAAAGMELGGGSLAGQGSFAGASDVGMKVSAAGDAVTIRAAAAVRCGGGRSSEGEGVGTGPVAPDGSFNVQLTKRAQFTEPGFRSSVVAAGRITGERATGTLRVSTSLRGRRRCSGTQSFVARVVPDLSSAATAPAPGGATLLGRFTGLAPSGAPFAFNLRVSGDGRNVTRTVAGFFDNWNRRNEDLEETNYYGRIPIRSDGTFSKTERFTIRFEDGNERSVIRTNGRFVAGGATGTFRVTKTFRSKRTGRVLARSDSGLVRWSAAP